VADHDTAARLAGATLYDRLALQLGKVSAETFDRDGTEDHRATVLRELAQSAP